MIRSPIGLRIDSSPDRSPRESLEEAARLGAKGVVLEAIGPLSPDRIGETGRRELRQLLRNNNLDLVALSLPTRRPFDTEDQLEDRLARADQAFALAFESGCRLALARVGSIPPEEDAERLAIFTGALTELAQRADHRGIRFAIEVADQAGSDVRSFLERLDFPTLAASVDPGPLLQSGLDPVLTVRDLGGWLAHAYASDSSTTSAPQRSANPRSFGFRPGVLDWAEYLGSLEEVDYQGFLTIWPDPRRPIGPQFTAMVETLKRF